MRYSSVIPVLLFTYVQNNDNDNDNDNICTYAVPLSIQLSIGVKVITFCRLSFVGWLVCWFVDSMCVGLSGLH